MGWFFRKSKSFGPFRLNFSKSGVGFSFGVKGARLSVNSRGTYVNLGSGGIYYRQRVGGGTPRQDGLTPTPNTPIPEKPSHTITTGDLEQVTDVDSQEFINELQEKHNKISLLRWLGTLPSVIVLLFVVRWLDEAVPTSIQGAHVAVWFIFIVSTLVIWCGFLYRMDVRRKRIDLYYTFDEAAQQLHNRFLNGFRKFMASRTIWQKLHEERIVDTKYHSGASQLVSRSVVRVIKPHKLPSPFIRTNVSVPYIRLRKTELFFLPERLLLKRGNRFAGCFYSNLRITGEDVQFVENGTVPADATVAYLTWKYVNKRGGPDRRYRYNPQIPVCIYTDYTIESGKGIRQIFTTSKRGAMDEFCDVVKEMGQSLCGRSS